MDELKKHYLEVIVPELKKKLKRTNTLSLPRLQKIVVNVGLSEPQHQDQAIKSMGEQLAQITGQKAKVAAARKSIAAFRLRQGDPIGLVVTLRGERMYQFLNKVIRIVLPRLKDFQGVPTDAFDQAGNYSLGMSEQIVFPEIDYDKIDRVRGLQINIISTAANPQEGRMLLELLGMPFKKENN